MNPSPLESLLRQWLLDVVRQAVREELAALSSKTTPTALPAPDDRYITASQAAELVGVHTDTIRDWAAQGLLPSYRAGRSLRFRTSEVHQALRSGVTKEKTPTTEEAVARIMESVRKSEERVCGSCGHSSVMHAGGRTRCRVRQCQCALWKRRPDGRSPLG